MTRLSQTIDEYAKSFLAKLESDWNAFKSSNQAIGGGNSIYKVTSTGDGAWTGKLNPPQQQAPYRLLTVTATAKTQSILQGDLTVESFYVNGVSRRMKDYMTDNGAQWNIDYLGNNPLNLAQLQWSVRIVDATNTATYSIGFSVLATDDVAITVEVAA